MQVAGAGEKCSPKNYTPINLLKIHKIKLPAKNSISPSPHSPHAKKIFTLLAGFHFDFKEGGSISIPDMKGSQYPISGFSF